MPNCQRCATGEVSWANGTATLLGEVAANLCAGCRTEWAGFLRAQPVWQGVIADKARESHLESLAVALRPPSEADWLDLERRKDRTRAEARALALEFVKPLTNH